MKKQPLFTWIVEAADIIGCSPAQVQGMIDRGELPWRKIGNRTYVNTKAMYALADDEAVS